MANKEDIIDDDELDSEDLEDEEELDEEEDDKSSSKGKKGKKSKKPMNPKELKPAQQNTVSDNFTKAIKNYLDGFAATDEHFAKCYSNPNKSIVECCAYIVGQVQKMGVRGLADDEVFQMARHYYLEEIDPKDLQVQYQPNRVVTNEHVELSEEEKAQVQAQAKEQVLKEYKEKCIKEEQARIKAEEERTKKEEEKARKRAEAAAKKKEEQEAKKKAEEDDPNKFSGGLFDFL